MCGRLAGWLADSGGTFLTVAAEYLLATQICIFLLVQLVLGGIGVHLVQSLAGASEPKRGELLPVFYDTVLHVPYHLLVWGNVRQVPVLAQRHLQRAFRVDILSHPPRHRNSTWAVCMVGAGPVEYPRIDALLVRERQKGIKNHISHDIQPGQSDILSHGCGR